MTIKKKPGPPGVPLAQRRISISVGFTYKEIEKLEKMAIEQEMTRSNMIRKIVIRALNKQK